MIKSSIAMAIIKLRDDNQLQLDDSIDQYIPELKMTDLLTSDAPVLKIVYVCVSMSSGSTAGVRKTRSTSSANSPNEGSNLLDELRQNLSSPIEFTQIYDQCYQIATLRSSLIEILCNILTDFEHVDSKVLLFIVDALITNHESLTDQQIKQDILTFIKHNLLTNEDNQELLLSILRFLTIAIEHRSNVFNSILTEWLSSVLHFIVTRISTTSYSIYGDTVIDLLTKIVQYFTPLPKEIVDVLGRSPSSIISTNFLTQLKSWVKHVDDTKLALFAIHLWEPLAALLSRLLTRGHTKGNEMLAVIQDAFVVANYSIRSAAFSAWGSFMSHIYRSDGQLNHDDLHQQQLHNRLLKLFLTPFLSDSTSKSKSASIAKCRAWSILAIAYPTHLDDVILPFLAFAFGNQSSSKTISNWWIECRKFGAQGLHQLLTDNNHAEFLIKTGSDHILNYLFDSITDEFLETSIEKNKSIGLISWNAYLTHLIHLFTTNNSIEEQQRVAINTCLLTRIEQLWIDARVPTEGLLKLFDAFEQTNFPLAIETILRDTSVRTKTLSASQNSRSETKSSSSSNDSASSTRTTLSDQYLHMLIEHSIRFTNTHEDAYLHVLSYLIDTLSKTSDDNFCQQTRSLLQKCSSEFSLQPVNIPSIFWPIWFRCSTHLINILNRTRSVEFNNQRQEITIELLLQPFAFVDCQRLDYSYTLLWIQLFKALSRVVLLDDKHLIHLFNELFRHGLVFEQAINENQNQRLLGFLLTTIKCLLKTLIDMDLSTVPKRSNSIVALCFTQLSRIMNTIIQRILIDDEQQNQWPLICLCLVKSNIKTSSKSFVFTYIRDLIVDLFTLCKTASQLEIILTNLTQISSFLHSYESLSQSSAESSSTNKTSSSSDNVILNKVITTFQTVFESTNSSSLLQLSSPLFILAFQHSKTAIRNKMRKCWNETFGRLTFISYPNELRLCLRDLKEKEHLLLPCFLADHDTSNTVGSMILPNSAEESQLSQQVDIATPLVIPVRSSPARFSSPCLSATRSVQVERNEPVFVPITNNIDHDNPLDSPVIISKRMSSTSAGLTEKQKEKLRARHAIPILCDDNSNTQSSLYAMDTPTIESMMATYQLRSTSAGAKQSSNGNSLSLFKQPTSDASSSTVQSSQENNTPSDSSSSSPPPPSASTSGMTTAENENSPEQILSNSNDDDIPEESSIAKKLRRSRRPSTSARKSLTINTRKKRSTLPSDEATPTTNTITSTVPSITIESPATNIEMIKTRPLKGILKRLSPTKPRSDHTRHVAFHDQVKVLLFASPARRDPNSQPQKKKSPMRDETKPMSTIMTRRSSGIHIEPPPMETQTSSSKSSILTELSLKSTDTEPIFPALIDCDKPLDSLIHVVYGGVCPTNAINYFRSIKMNTVGDIARSTASQIEVYPLPPPKLANIQKALALYQERLVTSPSLSPIIGPTGESLTPIASTSEESIAISDGTFTKEGSSLPTIINDPQHSLYDVDTLIDSLDYERLYLNDKKDIDDNDDNEEDAGPTSTSQTDFIRTRRQIALANRDEQISPQKRRLSSTNPTDQETDLPEEISPKKSTFLRVTLGERLQKAAETYQTIGRLPFDDDYIELIRQLFNNPSLTHLEQLHLKSLFLD